MDRQKSKTIKTYSFELFRLKERDVPIEVLEIANGSATGNMVVIFAWEPKGHRFCLVHGEPPRVDCSFYTMQKEGKPQVQKRPIRDKRDLQETKETYERQERPIRDKRDLKETKETYTTQKQGKPQLQLLLCC